MTDSHDLPRTYRRVWPEGPGVFNTVSAQGRRNGPEAIARHVSAAGAAHACGNDGGQPSAEVIAHMVLALSRYLRQLNADGGHVSTQLEELIAFLVRVRERQGMPVLDRSRAASDSSAVPS